MWPGAGLRVLLGSRHRILRLCRCFQSSVPAEKVVESLQERGLVNQCTDVSAEDVPRGSSVYVGFDPTADSLHTGNLVAIVALAHFYRAGFQPIAVIGGATGRVGDPSGRGTERDKLSEDTIKQNLTGIENDLRRIFQNVNESLPQHTEQKELLVLNNTSWWDEVNGVSFVSDIARHFRISAMLNKESVKQRLQSDEGMSCSEFLYPIFQAYDFLQLYKHHNCRMQLGGGDQWGNITSGCGFVRKVTGNSVHGLTLPLLTSSSGEKFSKSTGNAVWLCPYKTSPFELYQHFVSTPDQIVHSWLKYFTFLSTEEIEEIMKLHERDPSQYKAQSCLAEHVTRLVHGGEGVHQAHNATMILFGKNATAALMKLSEKDLEQLFRDAPTKELPLSLLEGPGLTVAKLAVDSGAVESQWHAENFITRGGLYINQVRVSSTEEMVGKDAHLLVGNITLLRVGKKHYTLVRWK